MAKASRKSASRRAPSASRPRFCKRYAHLADLPVVHRHAAGIDLGGATSHFVALEVGEVIEVREFGITTPDLHALVAYLQAHAVTTVAMESTGVYWMPLYDLLEAAGIEVYLVNPAHVKNVPGRRKDDKQDCRWLQKLHKYGLLSASFRPSAAMRPLRSFARQRGRLVRQVADEIRRIQKALDMMNVQVHKVLSDVMGMTGQRILRAIAAGERDPAVLAASRDQRCQCTVEELRQALTGYYPAHLVLELQQALARYDFLVAQIAELDEAIQALLRTLVPLGDAEITARLAAAPQPLPTGKHAPAYNVAAYVELVTGRDPTILPGIAGPTALGLLAELGTDMTKWATHKHFGSYLTYAPQTKISGGKVLATQTRQGGPPAAALFRQAAASAIQSDTAIGAFYRRLALRIGSAKALTATAYKIARMYYYLMKEGRAYVEVGVQAYEATYQRQQLAALERKAKALGYRVTPLAS